MSVPVAALVSGGVDSSVALCLLKEQGYDITAFYLKIWLEDELAYLGSCPWQEDLKYIEEVCAKLGVKLEVVSLQAEYWSEVVSYTISQIKAGLTPNPDILCNQRIKFGAFFNKISPHFKFVATGHYAQIERKDNITYLCTALDKVKDQTYFLSHLNQEQLARALFPIGHLYKTEVRQLAKKFDLPNQDRKDSQGICFLGKLKFAEFVKFHLGEKIGDLVEFETNKILGQHNGYWFFTLGQRQGLGLSGGPWYVVSKDVHKNIVYISKQYYSSEKERKIFYVSQPNWIPSKPNLDQTFGIKLRHGPNFNQAELTRANPDYLQVTLKDQEHSITTGQFAVFYDISHKYCLGGVVITDFKPE